MNLGEGAAVPEADETVPPRVLNTRLPFWEESPRDGLMPGPVFLSQPPKPLTLCVPAGDHGRSGSS